MYKRPEASSSPAPTLSLAKEGVQAAPSLAPEFRLWRFADVYRGGGGGKRIDMSASMKDDLRKTQAVNSGGCQKQRARHCIKKQMATSSAC